MGDQLGIFLEVTRDQRIVAYLAVKARGKIKGKDLELYGQLRDSILGEFKVIQEGEQKGAVEFESGNICFKTFEHLEAATKCLDRMLDTESGAGVEVDLATAALTLQNLLTTACREHAPPKPVAADKK